MARIVFAILAFGAIMAIFQMVIIALVVAGLIFRTKETIGLLLIGGLITLLQNHPAIGFSLLALLIVMGIVYANRKAEEPEPAPSHALIEHQPDDPAQE